MEAPKKTVMRADDPESALLLERDEDGETLIKDDWDQYWSIVKEGLS